MVKVKQQNDPPRSYTRFIATFADGELESAASEMMQEVGRDLLAHAKAKHGKVKGAVTLALNFEVSPEGMVTILPRLTKKAPPLAARAATMWLNDDGNAVDDNPRQTKLALRGVEGGVKREPQMEDEGASA